MILEQAADRIMAEGRPEEDWPQWVMRQEARKENRTMTVKECVDAVMQDHVYAVAWVSCMLGFEHGSTDTFKRLLDAVAITKAKADAYDRLHAGQEAERPKEGE